MFSSYQEMATKDDKKYRLVVDTVYEVEDPYEIIYVLTIYEVKKYLLLFHKQQQVLRTVATDKENANLDSMIELGKHYINSW